MEGGLVVRTPERIAADILGATIADDGNVSPLNRSLVYRWVEQAAREARSDSIVTGEGDTRERALSRARIVLAAIGDDADDGFDGTNAVDLIVDLLHYLRSVQGEDDGSVLTVAERYQSAFETFADEESEWNAQGAPCTCAQWFANADDDEDRDDGGHAHRDAGDGCTAPGCACEANEKGA